MRWLAGLATLCALLVGAAHEPAAGHAARLATPYLQLFGTIPITGQATVATGDSATAFGSGFCGAPGCSAVTLTVGERIAARAVEVSENGTFRASFSVTEDPGRYTVRASQVGADGATLQDFATLVVAIGDVEKNEAPRVTLQVVNAQRGRFLAAMHPQRCCAQRTAYFQRRLSADHWRSVKRFVLNRYSARRFTVSLPDGRSIVRVLVPKTARFRSVASRPVLVRR